MAEVEQLGPGEFTERYVAPSGRLTGLAPTVLVHTGDGLPDTLTVAPGTHAHANWAFAREGIYRLTIQVTATRADGRSTVDTDVFTIAVGVRHRERLPHLDSPAPAPDHSAWWSAPACSSSAEQRCCC